MKNVLKSTLLAVAVIGFVAACGPKTETTTAETQDTVKVDSTQVAPSPAADTTATTADSTATK